MFPLFEVSLSRRRDWEIFVKNADLSLSVATWWSDSGHVASAARTRARLIPGMVPSANSRSARCCYSRKRCANSTSFSPLRCPKVEEAPPGTGTLYKSPHLPELLRLLTEWLKKKLVLIFHQQNFFTFFAFNPSFIQTWCWPDWIPAHQI